MAIAPLALFVVLASSGTASAHATYEDSDPADESTISRAPSSVWAEFSEPLSEGSYMRVFDPCGAQVDAEDVEISGYRMTVSMSSDKEGEFSVRFIASSAIDPHTTSGEFTFTAMSGEPCASASDLEEEDASQPEEQQADEAADTEVSDSADTSMEDERQVEAESDVQQGPTEAGDATNKTRGVRKAKEIELAAKTTPREPPAPGLFGDVPWGSFGLSLLFALLIGAAGGKVYAGIMGPRA